MKSSLSLLQEWLEAYGIWDEFKKRAEATQTGMQALKKAHAIDYITIAFPWGTADDANKWAKVSLEWEDYLEKILGDRKKDLMLFLKEHKLLDDYKKKAKVIPSNPYYYFSIPGLAGYSNRVWDEMEELWMTKMDEALEYELVHRTLNSN